MLVAAVSIGITSPTYAQDFDEDDEIIVTGSRIKKKDFISNSPVATVDAAQFEKTFSINTENLLNTLPQTVPGLDRTSNNPGNGSATVDLRGIGSNRTLVLVNGTRQIPFGSAGVVDLNTIPTSLIQNVEVLTGGASSVYGADAVAGVVNFILKDDFEGVETNVGYAFNEQGGDGGLLNLDVTIGANVDGGRGNVVLNASYTDREEVFQGDRDFSTFAQFDDGAGGFINGGSSGSLGTTFFNFARNIAGPTWFENGVPSNSNGNSFFDQDGSIRPFVSTGNENDFYNYAPVNFLQLPQERYTITALGDYEVNDNLEVYGRASFSQNRVDSQLAPTPIFGFNTITVDGNPFITDESQRIISQAFADRDARVLVDPTMAFDAMNNLCTNCVLDTDGDGVLDAAPITNDADGDGIADFATVFLGRRLREVGPRITQDINDAFQITIGARGDLSETWSYDVYGQSGRTVRALTQLGNVNRDRFQQALRLQGEGTNNVVAACSDTSSNGGTSGCAPLNIFGEGNISEDAAAFINTAVASTAEFSQEVLQANVTGDLGGLRVSEDPIGVAFGAEYIQVSSDFRPSQDLAAGTIAGFNGAPPLRGDYEVYSVYGEASIPLLSGMPMIERLTLDVAGRYSDYSTTGGAETYKIGGEWALTENFRLRGNYNRAVRAPNIGELFSPIAEGFPSATDPCSAAGSPDAAVAAVCAATGVPQTAIGSPGINTISSQVRALSGGNPDLDVEKADTITFGFVADNLVEGLALSVDYYDIDINNAIAAFGGGAQNVLNVCYTDTVNGGAGSQFCNVINRQGGGLIESISLQAQNVASTEVSGIDLAAQYSVPISESIGEVGLRYLGTVNLQNDFTPFSGGDVVSCDGEFGQTCGEPDPSYRHRFTSNWSKGKFDVQGVWRYLGAVDDDAGAGVFSTDAIGDRSYFDVSVGIDVNETFDLTIGSNNILDSEPPIIGDNAEQANTYPASYDVFGRSFFANLKAKF